jgi:hypothetical protein
MSAGGGRGRQRKVANKKSFQMGNQTVTQIVVVDGEGYVKYEVVIGGGGSTSRCFTDPSGGSIGREAIWIGIRDWKSDVGLNPLAG